MIYPWQKKQWSQLLQAYRQDRLSHAYVLAGPPGLGKNDFSLSFAAFLLCDHRDIKSGEPCHQCVGCQWMEAKTHPDFFHLTPLEKTHSIKIDQVRGLIDKLTRKSQRGDYQVVILSPAEAMPAGAANALLKTLEEPVGKTLFLLVTDQADQLPMTIRSRCQLIHFQGARDVETIRWLQSQSIADDQEIATLLSITGDAPLKVKLLLEQQYLSLRQGIVEYLLSIVHNHSPVIAPVADWLTYGTEWVFYALLMIGADLSKIQMRVSHDFIMNSDQLSALQTIAQTVSVLALQRWIQLVLEKKRLIAQGINLNAQLMFENLMIEWERSRM